MLSNMLTMLMVMPTMFTLKMLTLTMLMVMLMMPMLAMSTLTTLTLTPPAQRPTHPYAYGGLVFSRLRFRSCTMKII